jgi:2-oxoglutarate dehydrogenase E2 component (dihydrolipoamide succinyltransferase)
MAVEVRIPTLGESVSEGVIARWLKENGDVVGADEPLLELETDKASMEIPAESAGKLEILVEVGATVQVGDVVARIDDSAKGDAAPAAKAEAKPAAKPAKAAPTESAGAPVAASHEATEAERAEPAPSEAKAGEDPRLSPAVRRLVEENGIDPSSIEGTGKDGRLTKEDVLRHLEAKPSEPAAAATAPAPRAEEKPAARETPSPAPGGADAERVPMSRLRKRIAERLVEAQRTAAILTTFNEIDMSAVMSLRKRYKERFEKRHGVGLGFMSLFARACVLALRDVPIVNASIDGDDVVYHKSVNLGVAVATEAGLVVPVVRGADRMSLAEIEKAIGEVAKLARDRKLTPDHLSGGTFSITNGGIFGSLLSTPILNPPNSGILGMHKIEERPVAVDGQVVIRPMMYVALSYDHRIVDGEQAVTFLVRVKERLEDPSRMLLDV